MSGERRGAEGRGAFHSTKGLVMAPRGRGYRGVPASRATRLSKQWCRSHQTATVALTTTQVGLTSCTLAETTLHDATILRTRGEILITGTPDAASDVDMVGLGIVVVSATAFGVGGASLPGPLADSNADFWLWHKFVPLDALTLTAGDPQSITTNVRIEVDSKAMRRISTDQTVVLMAELANGNFASVDIISGMAWLFGS